LVDGYHIVTSCVHSFLLTGEHISVSVRERKRVLGP
jgi:hypothetical protein